MLCLTSLIFITNSITAFWNEYYLYSLLFGNLTITSIIYHAKPTLCTNIVDKFAIASVVFYGAHKVYQKRTLYKKISIIIVSYLLVLYLFLYGYYTNNYCFHPERGNAYHSLLHMISSLGHHCIVFL